MAKERRVGRHSHHVGIALKPGNESCFRQCTFPVVTIVGTRYTDALRCVFAREDLWPVAWIVVISSGILAEPLRRHVVVLVDQVCIQLTHLLPKEVEPLSVRRWSGTRDESNVWILLLQNFGEELVALDVLRSPLLIPDANHLQVKRLRVPHLSAHPSPFRIDWSVGKLDQIGRILDVMIEIFEWRQFA